MNSIATYLPTSENAQYVSFNDSLVSVFPAQLKYTANYQLMHMVDHTLSKSTVPTDRFSQTNLDYIKQLGGQIATLTYPSQEETMALPAMWDTVVEQRTNTMDNGRRLWDITSFNGAYDRTNPYGASVHVLNLEQMKTAFVQYFLDAKQDLRGFYSAAFAGELATACVYHQNFTLDPEVLTTRWFQTYGSRPGTGIISQYSAFLRARMAVKPVNQIYDFCRDVYER